jgi:hypothetical protein
MGGGETARAAQLTGEEFVHVAPRRFLRSIVERGLDPAASGGRVYVPKLKYVLGRTAEELESALYRQQLRGGKAGYFREGGYVFVVLPEGVQVIYRGVTTRPGGVPQWTYEGPPLRGVVFLEPE